LKWFIASTKKKRIFLVGSDYIFPHAANAIIRDQAAELGGKIVGEEYRQLGSSDTGTIIRKIQATKPEVILNTINGDSNISFFRALRATGSPPCAIAENGNRGTVPSDYGNSSTSA